MNIPEPTAVLDMSLEQLVPIYLELREKRDEIEAAISDIGKIGVARLDEEGVKGKVVGEYAVTKTTRVVFKTTIDQAKELGAVKESVDSAKLKQLYDAGANVPGANVIQFLGVRTVVTLKKEK